MVRKILFILILNLFIFSTCNAKLVEDTYIVKEGDTLQSIAEYFITKNTYGPRDIREFKEGIKELNYDILNNDEVAIGQTLRINYWTKD